MSVEAELRTELDHLYSRLSSMEARLLGTHRRATMPGTEVEVLLVTLGALEAAFELSAVKEVVPAATLAPLPEAPPWVLGTLNLRGTTVPVVHVGSRLKRESRGLKVQDLIVVAATELGTAGFVVSAVGAIANVTLDQTASLTETPHAAYVVGSFSYGEEARLLLGIRELLRHTELSSLIAEHEEQT